MNYEKKTLYTPQYKITKSLSPGKKINKHLKKKKNK